MLTAKLGLENSLAKASVKGIKSTLANFLCYFEDDGIKDFREISIESIRSFLVTTSVKNPHGMGNIIYGLRKFWKYLLSIDAVDIDVTIILHKPAEPHKRVLPCFTKDDAKAILSHVQDGTSRGYRNYAILLLALHTGLRMIDIVNLKLDNIDWLRKEIIIQQHKTGGILTLPLDSDTGNAIAEYIINFRPDVQLPYIFLRCLAPFTKLSDQGTGANIMNPYLLKAGIIPKKGYGFHAFRRSMGTWLIESGADVPITAQILGHINHDSSKRYISLHYSGLRVCCMSLSGIAIVKEGFK